MSSDSPRRDYSLLVGKRVCFYDDGSIHTGTFKKLGWDKKTQTHTAEIQIHSINFFGILNRKVPVSRIRAESFEQLQATTHVTKDACVASNRLTFRFNGAVYDVTSHVDFTTQDDVVWDVGNSLRPQMGKIQLIGRSSSGSYAAVVQFDEDTRRLPGSVQNAGSYNKNVVLLKELHKLKEWLRLYSPEPKSSTPTTKKESIIPSTFSSATAGETNLHSVDDLLTNVYLKTDSTPTLETSHALPSTVSKTKKPKACKENCKVYDDITININEFLNQRKSNPNNLYGIEGEKNSCYMDASVFAIFAFNTFFDSNLLSVTNTENRDKYSFGQLVGQWRNEYYIAAKEMRLLRNVFVRNYDPTFRDAYKDAEEFIQLLFEFLEIPELFSYDSGGGDYIHQIFLPASWSPSQTVPYLPLQTLLEDSFMTHELKLASIPDVFILKLPVSNGVLIPCEGVIPNLEIDISPILSTGEQEKTLTMHLSTVICLRNQHFVAFARTTLEHDSPWVFMDSKPFGGPPETSIYRDIGRRISQAEQFLGEWQFDCVEDVGLPNGYKLFRDAYICIYSTLQQ